MKLLSIMITVEPVRLAEAVELTEFGYFKKGSVKEVLTFVSRKVVSRSAIGEKSSVSHEEYVAHVRVTNEKLACVALTDKEYPGRVAFDLIQEALAAFNAQSKDWSKLTADTLITVPLLDSLLKKYQKPQEADKLMKIQKDVDEVKQIMNDMLDNNEKLEDLVTKSEDLSTQSKTFMKQSKKLNSCC